MFPLFDSERIKYERRASIRSKYSNFSEWRRSYVSLGNKCLAVCQRRTVVSCPMNGTEAETLVLGRIESNGVLAILTE